ncbi:hypothetical protein JMN32_00095 [Fulvivirga sp. 29W222]|uniref:Uncharacterized protein n=1 Tax=Fulvivirga marina TaxID=2494733 RepID=A0A937FUH6_9BACT|nr:hypothetical protein [Fulvivirga marina]MBL6444687.1 hypothetical protein [Fulvivirga marina]
MKAINMIAGAAITGGAAYLVWRHTSVGKQVMSKWLTRKWLESAGQEGVKLDKMKMDKAMYQLTHQDLELLVRYTMLGIMDKHRTGSLDERTRQKGLKLYQKMEKSGTFKRSDVRELGNVLFPVR